MIMRARTLNTPFPMSVAPKNSQKGILNAPQQMPHRSNAAFGHDANSRMPRNPCFWITSIIQRCMLATMRGMMPSLPPAHNAAKSTRKASNDSNTTHTVETSQRQRKHIFSSSFYKCAHDAACQVDMFSTQFRTTRHQVGIAGFVVRVSPGNGKHPLLA